MDQEKSKYARLLGNPEYNLPTEWFDEAITNWLGNNMGKFLATNPGACHYFLKDEKHAADVAYAISLEESNREVLVKFIKALDDDYRGRNTFSIIAKRLAEADLADLAIHAKGVHFMDPEGLEPIVTKMSTEVLVSVMKDIDWSGARWRWADLEKALYRLSPEQHRIMVGVCFSTYEKYKDLAPRMASTLASKLPYSDIGDFAGRYLPKFGELTCMSCGNIELRSKPGYTLHRKVCDRENKFPSLYLTLKERMQSRK